MWVYTFASLDSMIMSNKDAEEPSEKTLSTLVSGDAPLVAAAKESVIGDTETQDIYDESFLIAHKDDQGPSHYQLPAVQKFGIDGDVSEEGAKSSKKQTSSTFNPRTVPITTEELEQLAKEDGFAANLLQQLNEALTLEQKSKVLNNANKFFGRGEFAAASSPTAIPTDGQGDTGALEGIKNNNEVPTDKRFLASQYQDMRTAAKTLGVDTSVIDEMMQTDLGDALKQQKVLQQNKILFAQADETAAGSDQQKRWDVQKGLVTEPELDDQFKDIPKPVRDGFGLVVDLVRKIDKGVITVGTSNFKQEVSGTLAKVQDIDARKEVGKLDGKAENYVALSLSSLIKMVQLVDQANTDLTPSGLKRMTEDTFSILCSWSSNSYEYFKGKYEQNQLGSIIPENYIKAKEGSEKVAQAVTELPNADMSKQAAVVGAIGSIFFVNSANKRLHTAEEAAAALGLTEVEVTSASKERLRELGLVKQVLKGGLIEKLEGEEIVRKIRQGLKIKESNNVAVANLVKNETGEMLDTFVAVSVKNSPPGTVPTPSVRRYPYEKLKGAIPTEFDSELKIMEDIYSSGVPRDAKMTLNFYSERYPCKSCREAFKLFREDFPNITINCTFSKRSVGK